MTAQKTNRRESLPNCAGSIMGRTGENVRPPIVVVRPYLTAIVGQFWAGSAGLRSPFPPELTNCSRNFGLKREDALSFVSDNARTRVATRARSRSESA
jgi:hypothetical protein